MQHYRAVPCPKCQAPAGAPCVYTVIIAPFHLSRATHRAEQPVGTPMRRPHLERFRAWHQHQRSGQSTSFEP